MKKSLLLLAIIILSCGNIFAQEKANEVDEVIEKAKSGSFYLGANFGFSLISDNYYGNSNDDNYGSFNFGVDVAYLFELIDNLEVGGLVGYTQYIASGSYQRFTDSGSLVRVNFDDASFIPVAASARYYFADHKFFGGIDLGVGINVAGDAKTGFYARPKFGFDLGKIALIASFQSISGGQDYSNGQGNGNNAYSLNGFNSVNFGAEFGF
jgi:hypothetical protein